MSFQLLNLGGNLDLVARRGLPLPALTSFDYGSFNPGTEDEGILVFQNSSPVALAPGRWYLGVFNADVTNVVFTILATEYTNGFPNIVNLASGVSFPANNSGTGDATDYYHYVVTTNARRAQFEIDGPTGDMTLVARKGCLPTLTDYACLSANPGPNEELITLYDFSSPIALTPGDWFISAVNVWGAPVGYSIMALSSRLTAPMCSLPAARRSRTVFVSPGIPCPASTILCRERRNCRAPTGPLSRRPSPPPPPMC